jgi:hypothetical protein
LPSGGCNVCHYGVARLSMSNRRNHEVVANPARNLVTSPRVFQDGEKPAEGPEIRVESSPVQPFDNRFE